LFKRIKTNRSTFPIRTNLAGLRLSFTTAIALLMSAAMPGAQAAPAPAKTISDAPLIFYVAKGAPHICGPGCSEWIAVEGSFGVGAAAQFRALLSRLGKQKLPVFFHSPGGLVEEALTIGRLMREKGMTSGVGRTVPEGCSDEKRKKECDDLKKSGKTLDGDLLTSAGLCSSACVYALLGGKTRVVSPGARIGVHAVRSVNIANKQVKMVDLTNKSAEQQRADRKRYREKLRTYVREMGTNVQLVDVAEDVPHEKIHYLTRNQIAELNIDRSTFTETPWKFVEGPSIAPAMSKFFMEARGQEKTEFPASYIRLGCGNSGKATVLYSRGMTSGETNKWQIKLLVGDDGLQVASTGVRQYDWIENERSFDVRFAVTDFSRLRVSGDVLEIVETSWALPAPYAHIVRLSTQGWGEALGRLREKCMNPDGFSDRGTRG
jgi:hypothetical protein